MSDIQGDINIPIYLSGITKESGTLKSWDKMMIVASPAEICQTVRASIDIESPACYIFTSGTTGKHLFVKHSIRLTDIKVKNKTRSTYFLRFSFIKSFESINRSSKDLFPSVLCLITFYSCLLWFAIWTHRLKIYLWLYRFTEACPGLSNETTDTDHVLLCRLSVSRWCCLYSFATISHSRNSRCHVNDKNR